MALSQTRQEFIEKYAPVAMEQMKRYGIPASVTLAQAAVESGDGHSYLAENANNFFGVKGSFNGQYEMRTDDHHYPEKFKKYDNVMQSFEDHSKVLNASRYTRNNGWYSSALQNGSLANLSSKDYNDKLVSYVQGVKKGGYATHPGYVKMLTDTINLYDLEKYDRQVMQEMQGKAWGVKANPVQGLATSQTQPVNLPQLHSNVLGDSKMYFMPLTNQKDMLVVTSGFGVNRGDHNHGGLDFRAHRNALFATEDNGVVAKIDNAGKTAAGKYVTVEYPRADGSKLRCTYMHMSTVNVSVGQTVNAKDVLGISGNTGRSTGEHLHFETALVSADGKVQKIDPREYLAAMQVAAPALQTQVMDKNTSKDLLADYKAAMTQDPLRQQQYAQQAEEQMDPNEWYKQMLLSDEKNAAYANDGDLFSKIIEMMIALWMVAATQEKDASQAQRIEAAANAAMSRTIDLSAYCPKYKSANLQITDNHQALLTLDDGQGKVTEKVLSAEEVDRLTSIAKGQGDEQMKGAAITNWVNGVVFTNQASLNYDELERQQQQSQQQQMQR